MDKLTNDIWYQISLYLNPNDLIVLILCNRTLRHYLSSDSIWRNIVRKYFGEVLKSDVIMKNPRQYDIYIIYNAVKKQIAALQLQIKMQFREKEIQRKRFNFSMQMTGNDEINSKYSRLADSYSKLEYLFRTSNKSMILPTFQRYIRPRRGDTLVDVELLGKICEARKTNRDVTFAVVLSVWDEGNQTPILYPEFPIDYFHHCKGYVFNIKMKDLPKYIKGSCIEIEHLKFFPDSSLLYHIKKQTDGFVQFIHGKLNNSEIEIYCGCLRCSYATPKPIYYYSYF
jgi:hypothetical protein